MSGSRPGTHWIDGEWVASGARRDSIDPANGQAFGSYWDGGLAEARQAVEAARRTFVEDDWKVDAMRRATVLGHLGDAYDARSQELIDCLATENGKLKAEAGFEVAQIIRALRFASGLALQAFGRVSEPRPGVQSMVLRQAVGVAGIIVPWNSPAFLLVRALAPALAAGCTAVIKLPAQAAQAGRLSAEILASVKGLPKGAVNLFVESGSEGARHLVESAAVPVISFTGSSGTGRAIAMAGAARFKRVGLELGGKTPHLVFDDADLDAALPTIVASSTVFAGQFCVTGSRILVQRGIAESLKKGLVQRLGAVQAGPAADASSQMGPLIDRQAVLRVDSVVKAALAQGATALVRGGPITTGPLEAGAFYRPTLLEVPSADLAIVREEVFGPVQTLQVFDTEDEAVALANDSDYGLSACIWSRDVDRPIRVARRLEAGHVCINDWANMQVEFEEGGFKHSGRGRLGGLASLEDFMEYKQVFQVFGRAARGARVMAMGALCAAVVACGGSSSSPAPAPAPTPAPAPAPTGTQLTPNSCCDGVFSEASIDGQHVWQTGASAGFLYFSVPASLGAVAGQPLYVAVQYRDTGYNKLAYQYDSSQGQFFTPEVTVHSSLLNTNTFATAYFAMQSPTLQKREGGNDFRISGTSGPVSIARVTIQKTPFADPTFQFALTKPWLTTWPGTADASTLQGKTMAGYQGWFTCPNDLNDQGWFHWPVASASSPVQGFPTWPDLSSYPASSPYAGARCKADNILTQSGQQAYAYSSSNPDVVAQHFAWMKQYDIDGIFLQRFLGGGDVPGSHPEWVLGNIRKSASQNNRLWAIEYDVSELTNSNVVATIEADWKWLNDAAHVRNDGNYAHNGGKPVVVVWGLACRAGYTPAVADTLIDFLKNDPVYGGNYMIGGICNWYNTMPTWTEHFQRYDGLQVWQPQDNAADRARFASWGADWYPHVWAGHHSGGQEYWDNLYSVIGKGADRFFIGMFDEYGENTAIIPISDDPPPADPPMLTNQGKPLTWWLQLSGKGKQMLLKQIPLSPTMPSP